MGKKRTIVYVKANLNKHEFLYTGIDFKEFFVSAPIKNLLLLKSNYIGGKTIKNFEVVEGQDNLELLSKDDIYSYGDFCFVDYQNINDVEQLTDTQVAGLLYLAHLYEPLETPFFDILQNKFTYLAHDDGFVCKLYCRENEDFIKILESKLKPFIGKRTKRTLTTFNESLQKKLIKLTEKGILIDCDEVEVDRRKTCIKIYILGEYDNMDEILNNVSIVKSRSNELKKLSFRENQWDLCDL